MEMNTIYLTSSCDVSGVDQMINEGLGGGNIIYEYDKARLELNQSSLEYKTNHMKEEK